MAENNLNDNSSGIDTDRFETPPQSDEEPNVNVKKLFLGEAYDQMDEQARENQDLDTMLDMNVLKDDEDQDAGSDEGHKRGHRSDESSQEERKAHEDSSEDKVDTNMDDMVLYTVRNENGESMRVLKFTNLYLPDTDKLRDRMERFNRKKMNIIEEADNMQIRERRRKLKESEKHIQQQYVHKSQFWPVNPFLEDFYYLEGHNKSGVAPQPGKKNQPISGYRHLFSQNRIDNSLIERTTHQQSRGAKRPQQALALPQPPQRAAPQPPTAEENQAAVETEQQKKNFTLEACQINELKGHIVDANTGTSATSDAGDISAADGNDGLALLRKRLRHAKDNLKSQLQQKLPVQPVTKQERQSLGFLSKMRNIYDQSSQQKQQPSQREEVLPTAVDIYELAIEEKFRQAGEATKRVKYWGELHDCVSEHQISKDAHMIKRLEHNAYLKNKKTYNQSVFALVNPSQTAIKFDLQGANTKDSHQPVGTKPLGGPNNAAVPGGGILKTPGADKAQGVGAQGALARAKRPQPLLVEKSNFDLVNTFEEYEKLKEQEGQYYEQSKKSLVSAESIMRHVRWKMGRISDKEFYQQECEEIKREQRLENEKSKALQRQQLLQRGRANQAGDMGETQREAAERAKLRGAALTAGAPPVEFKENLDDVFNSKRQEIQTNIWRRKHEKERASMQKQNTTQTPAYEPIPDINKDSDEEHEASEHHHKQSDKESSSSDSDSDSDDDSEKGHEQAAGHSMMPSIADELNHAQCIKDLSYFKLSWTDQDLETFHRPNIQTIFEQSVQNNKMTVKVTQQKKNDGEAARLNPHSYFKDRYRLSLNRGKFSIFEHIDQHPLFVNNFGMASRLRRYFYGDKVPTKKEFLNMKNENIRNRHMGPSGKIVRKQKFDRLDMLGQVDRQKFNGITLLENNLYNAPVFYHRMPSTSNDFFCSVYKRNQDEPRQMVIRALNSFYTVGQIEPKIDVYNPQSRQFTTFIKQQSKAYTTRLLQENKRLSFQDIRQFFPEIQSPVLKKGLKEIEVEQDRNGFCKLNDNFDMEKHKDRMTPEMICQYESAIHGQYRLAKIGIQKILSADKISYSTHKFCFEETDLILQRVAKLIESEVLQTPWNLSSSYTKIKSENSMMMLEGQGDPSYGHGGYSYLKMPLKISADSIQGAKANRMNLNPAIQNPKAVTGTEADLRKLKKDHLKDILLEAGVAPEELEKKTRWEMVAQLRCFASQNTDAKLNQTGMKSFYARGVRHTSKKQQEMYNKRANETFRTQMETLSDPNPKNLHDLSEEEPDFTQLPELEALGLKLIGKGFGTSLSQRDQENTLVQTKRDAGENAKDFTRDIYNLVNDEQRKQIVEVEEVPEIKSIENIKDYLKLFLVIHPNALSAQQHNPSGINIGGVSSNAEFMYAMSGNGSKEWEKKLLEKINSREITKKCEILCHKIRSLTQDDNDINPQEEGKDGEKKYERVIFQADEKAIKKFKRCMNKNRQKPPRRTNRRSHTRAQTRPLNEENLRQADRNRQGKSAVRSTSRSITSVSIQRGANSTINAKISAEKFKRFDNISQSGTQGPRSIMNSGQKPKSKKRTTKVTPVQQPSLRITNNGVVPGEATASQPVMIKVEVLGGGSQLQSNPEMQYMGHQQTNPPISYKVLPGNDEDIPMSQPAEGSKILLPMDPVVISNTQPQLYQDDDQDQVMDSEQQEVEENEDEGSDKINRSNKLFNNEALSNQSDYKPEVQSEISSDFDQQLLDKKSTGKNIPKKKSPSKKKSTESRYENINLILSRQTSNTRKNSRGNRKSITGAQKFKEHGFRKDDFEYQAPTSGKSRRRQQTDGTMSLNNLFMDIIEALWRDENSYYFQNQPTRQDAPNYRELIKHPIALKDMKNKSKRNEYKSRSLFEADLTLMVQNAEAFNGIDHYISQSARTLQERALEMIESRKGDIETMECVIQMDGAGL